jgi:hypothetical protein
MAGSVLIKWLVGSVVSVLHPFYISMTDINHNAKNKSLEVSVRIFTDDFEKALRKNCNCKVELLRPNDKGAMEKLAANYINSHLNIKVDGQPVQLQFAGFSNEDGSIWSFFEAKNVNSIKKLELFNNILHETNDQQINIVHVKANGKEKTEKLDYPKNVYSISW